MSNQSMLDTVEPDVIKRLIERKEEIENGSPARSGVVATSAAATAALAGGARGFAAGFAGRAGSGFVRLGVVAACGHGEQCRDSADEHCRGHRGAG